MEVRSPNREGMSQKTYALVSPAPACYGGVLVAETRLRRLFDAAASLFKEVFMKNKKLAIAALALIAVIGLMAGIWMTTRPETETGSKAYTVTVVHKDGSEKVFEYRTDAEYLAEALLAEGLVSGDNTQYGLTIITADGEAAVWDTDSAYWAIWVGEEMAITGASEIPVYDGGTYKLEYTRFE